MGVLMNLVDDSNNYTRLPALAYLTQILIIYLKTINNAYTPLIEVQNYNTSQGLRQS